MRVDLNPAIFASIVAEFIADSQVQISAIATGLQSENADGAGQAAHQIRGMAANVGGVVVADLSARIETACRAGNTEHAADLLVLLQPAASDLWSAIDEQLNGSAPLSAPIQG